MFKHIMRLIALTVQSAFIVISIIACYCENGILIIFVNATIFTVPNKRLFVACMDRENKFRIIKSHFTIDYNDMISRKVVY